MKTEQSSSTKRKKKEIPRRRGRGDKNSDTKPSESNSRALSSSRTGGAGALLIKLSDDVPTWYQVASQVPGRNATIQSDPPPEDASCATGNSSTALVEKYRSAGDELFRQEIQLFIKQQQEGGNNKNSTTNKDMSWIQSTISKGTLKDRIAAMSVVVSTYPIHKFHALDGLLQMAGCLSEGQSNSRVAQLAAEALAALFINTLLPDDRKLLTLAQRPLYIYEQPMVVNSSNSDLKSTKKTKTDKKSVTATKPTLSPRVLLLWRYEEMVKEKYNLFLRKCMGNTLREGPEQQKIAALRSCATLFASVPEGEATLLQMITNKLGDPARKVAASAAHELRNVLNTHPAMQNVIAREVQQLAHRPHLSSRALYNCITFLNQLKFSSRDSQQQEQQQQDGTSTPHTKSLPASLVGTYFRLFEVTVNNATKDADASAMKGRLLSALLSGVNRAHPYLPPKDQEMEAHVDALYRVVHKAPPAACTQALLLLFHLAVGSKLVEATDQGGKGVQSRKMSDIEKARQDRFYQTLFSRLGRSELLQSGKHMTMLFNLIYKAMKYDENKARVIAFAKQVLSTTMHCSPPIIAAAIFMLNEVAKFHSELALCFASTTLDGPNATRILDFKSQDPLEALIVKEQPDNNNEQGMKSSVDDNSGTLLASLWEISMLRNHHHPSVANFAGRIGSLHYDGDPLKDFALAPFLDKFAYRNPKSVERIESKLNKTRNSVVARHSGAASLAERQRALPLNDPSFLEQENIPAQDEFFHLFFLERAKREKMKDSSKDNSNDLSSLDQKGEGVVGMDDIALDNIQGKADFGSFEQNWELDVDEEAFVDQLALKIIEDSVDADELGPGDLDAEDPDMSNWDGLRDDDDVDDDDEQEDYDDDDDNESGDAAGAGNKIHRKMTSTDSDDDSFMGDDVDTSSDDYTDRRNVDVDDDEGDDAFMDQNDTTSDSGGSGEEDFDPFAKGEAAPEQDDDVNVNGVSDDVDHIPLVDSDCDLEVFNREDGKPNATTKKKKKQKDLPVFASAEEYEEKISKAWENLKGSAEDPQDESSEPTTTLKKNKRSRKK